MESYWILIWGVVAVFSVGYISYLLYQLFYKGKNLIQVASELQQAAIEARQKSSEQSEVFEKADATDPDTLFELLGQRRKRKRQVERKKQARQRRLIARISKIEINERFR